MYAGWSGFVNRKACFGEQVRRPRLGGVAFFVPYGSYRSLGVQICVDLAAPPLWGPGGDMKIFSFIGLWVFASVGVAGCGDTGDGLISPGDPSALSSAISIEGAVRIEGQPPAPGGGTGEAPVITGGSALEITSGDTAELQLGFESESGYEDCYVQVDGADDYFLISQPSGVTSGTITIEINIPPEIDTGAFSFYTCIVGANGSVSNPISTPVGVTNPGGNIPPGGNDFICASDDPQVGTLLSCPNGGMIDFCVNQSANACYYSAGGSQFSCASCTTQNGLLGCAQAAVESCF